MRLVSRVATSFLLSSLAVTAPSQASDFSKLAEPAFGRSMLISPVRERQKECAGLALYWSERGKSPAKEGAKRLADAVVARLTIEIGDAVLARSLVEGKAAGYADPTKTEPFWVEVRDYLTQKCEPYFDAAKKGDSELGAKLGPMPTELLQLPSEEQCLATADYARETGLGHWDEEVGDLLRKERFQNVDAKQRDARQAIVEGGLKFLRETKPDEDHLELMFVACLPTVRAAAERLGPDISDQLDR
jgi:hypothetical protein